MVLHNMNCFDLFPDLCELDNIKLIITDPPYLHNKGGGKTHGTEGKSKIANSDMYNFNSEMMKDLSSFTEQDIYLMLDEFKRIMTKMNCYIFTNDTLIPFYTMWATLNKKKFTVLTWEKPLSILNRNRFSQNLEYIVRIYDNGTALNLLDIDNYPEKKQYYSKNRKINPDKGASKFHPTQKPYEYILGLVELNSNEGDIIFDPFMGGGQIGVVCKDTGRDFIGVEMSEKHFNVAKSRLL